MKTFTKLFTTLLILIIAFHTSFAQIQIGQTISLAPSLKTVALSFDGNRMVIGSNDDVLVYELVAGQWIQLGPSINPGSVGFDPISISISYDGNRIAVGNSFYASYRGSVKIYDFVNGTWVQAGSRIAGQSTVDEVGTSVSLSADGNRIAIGAPINNGAGTNITGHISVFEFLNGDWVQLGADIDGEAAYDLFGSSVSLSANGNRVVAGAPGNDASGNSSGHARVYELSGNNWVQLGGDIDGEYSPDESGTSVSISADGTRVAVGAPFNFGSRGHARIYELVGNSWVQMGADIDGALPYDRAGLTVSLSADGNRAALSTYVDNFPVGQENYTKVYEWIAGSWLPINEGIYTPVIGQSRAALSPDGNTVAIGLSNFVSVFAAMTNLDVELTHFKATVQNHQTILNWSTASETNNTGFDIEHSTDGTNWQILGFERGQGTSQNSHTYTYTHETPSTGINYYRLKQVDFDGVFEYSEVVSVRISGRDGIEVFPNPTFGEIYISGIDYEELNIINVLGETVFSLMTPQPNIDVSHLPNGTYFIQLRQGDTHFVQKVTKE